ncbi:MAG: GH3 auxin-responsive promoter family protein [Anaerolineaceae bacterium]|nr:GH3 auxin-responsive promoter family protein [Anaerolineaceae bacterium]
MTHIYNENALDNSISLHTGDLMEALSSWQMAIMDPVGAQQKVLEALLKIYEGTEYGRQHHAGQVKDAEEYREAFPAMAYSDYSPLIQPALQGDHGLLLSEAPVGWTMTRGSGKNQGRSIPYTRFDLDRWASATQRSILSYVEHSGREDILDGVFLNLSFPSGKGKANPGPRETACGPGAALSTRLALSGLPMGSLPDQAEIDTLGGGKSDRDWEARFELAFQKCKNQNVTLAGGLASVMLDFGAYLHRKYKVYPKDVWKIPVLIVEGMPGINTRIASVLHAMYGPAAIREVYSAAEGVFGQQMDERRAWIPNIDLYYFEVETRSGIIGMHDMHPGEIGSLIVSTPVLPRYKIGDLIAAFQPPYFRCIGRTSQWTTLRYAWDELSTLNFGRL